MSRVTASASLVESAFQSPGAVMRFTEFPSTFKTKEEKPMTTPDQERWHKVKERLRAEVGEDVFQSWFKSMELDGLDGVTARLSVPTRFLKSWIQSHYIE